MHDADRLRERALALPVVCLLLFSPPLLTIVGRPVAVAGVPLSYLYVFGAWLGVILLGRRLAKRLAPGAEAGSRDVAAGTARSAGTTTDEG